MVYVLWETEGGSVSSGLLISKVRLTALKGTTIPKAERCAVVVMARLLLLTPRPGRRSPDRHQLAPPPPPAPPGEG